MKYLNCKVATIEKSKNEKSKNKVIKRGYLSDSISYTEAEVRIHEKMEKIVGEKGFFDLENITKMKFNGIFSSKRLLENSEIEYPSWFKIKVFLYTVDDQGKSKKITLLYLIQEINASEANSIVEEKMREDNNYNFEIISISKTDIVDVDIKTDIIYL